MLRLSAGILDTNWSRGRASTTSSAGGFGKIGTGCAAGIDGAAAARAFFAAFFAAVFTAVFAAEPASSPGFQGCVRGETVCLGVGLFFVFFLFFFSF
jgi:hypothetical protein